MNVPIWLKPALWGAVAGAIAAIFVGFFWGGWVTGGSAGQMAETSAEQAVVNAFTPLCVARAEEEPEQLLLLREESRWARRGFVEDAGWVANVNEDYRSAVATECAAIVVEGMDPEPDPAPAD